MKFFKQLFYTLLFAVFSAMLFSTAFALPLVPVAGVILATSFIPTGAGNGAFLVGVKHEFWTGETVMRFTHSGTFLDGVPDYSDKVNNDVIHLVEIGVHPEVLINNTSYPLPVNSRVDNDIPISLDTYDTEATRVTREEMFALSYDKIAVTETLHREALMMKTADAAIYNFAPFADSTATPVIKTTGADNGDGFKKITAADVLLLKKKFDDNKVPKEGRRLVLCNQHIADLLSLDQTFKDQYNDIREGRILKFYGFEIFEYSEMPLYDIAFFKKAFGALPEITDRDASIAFYYPRMFKALGSVEYDFTERDARNKYEEVSAAVKFIALPKKLEAIGAIVNDSVF